MAVDVRQRLAVRQIHLVDTDHHITALQGGDGSHPVNEVGVRHRRGQGGHHHQLVHVGHGGAVKDAAPRLDLPDHAPAGLCLPDLHPVSHQGTHTRLSELSPGTAGKSLTAGVHVVKAAEGLSDLSSTH